MPYTNVPKALWGKMDRCVQDVMAKQGVSKSSAIAICHDSVVKEAEMSNSRAKRKQASVKEDEPNLEEAPVIEEKSEEESEISGKWYDSETGRFYSTFGATSFAELDAARVANSQAETTKNLAQDFQAIVANILYDDDIEDKAAAIQTEASEFGKRIGNWQESLPTFKDAIAQLWPAFKAELTGSGRNDLPDSAFAYIEPGGKKDEGGKTVPRSLRHYPVNDKAHARNALSRAAAAIKKGGKTAEIARKAMPKIRAAAKKFGIKTESKETSLIVTKSHDGTWRWLGIFSNNFQDRSKEIITEAAHKEFVAFLDANPDQAPFFCPWHTWDLRRKNLVDFWDYSDGFMLVGGKLEEDEARALLKMTEKYEVGMSHAFNALERDPQNQRNITKYRSIEVSDLPVSHADNPWTSVLEVIPKEATMNANKRKYLVAQYGEDAVQNLEQTLKDGGMTLESLGVPRKDAQPPVDADDETQEPEAETPGEEPPQDAKEFVDAVLKAIGDKYSLDQLSEFLVEMKAKDEKDSARIEAMEKKIAELMKSDDEKIADKITPKSLIWAQERPSRSKDNEISKEEAEKDAPDGSWVTEVMGPQAQPQS